MSKNILKITSLTPKIFRVFVRNISKFPVNFPEILQQIAAKIYYVFQIGKWYGIILNFSANFLKFNFKFSNNIYKTSVKILKSFFKFF